MPIRRRKLPESVSLIQMSISSGTYEKARWSDYCYTGKRDACGDHVSQVLLFVSTDLLNVQGTNLPMRRYRQIEQCHEGAEE